MRDYEIVIEVPAAMRDGSGRSYIYGRFRYRFTHCPEVRVTTTNPSLLLDWTWGDEFIDFDDWILAGEPGGFVWGVGWAEAYPWMSYVPDSLLAAPWCERMGKEMHEVVIKTNVYQIQLVCHDLEVIPLAEGDPMTGELNPVEVLDKQERPKLSSSFLARSIAESVRPIAPSNSDQ